MVLRMRKFRLSICVLIAVAVGVFLWFQRPADPPELISAPQMVEAQETPPAAADPAGVFERTVVWIEEVRHAGTDDGTVVSQGKELLRERRAALAEVMVSDPERALELALTDEERARVPSEWHSLLEQPLRGSGDLLLGIVCSGYHEPGAHPESEMFREAVVQGQVFSAHTYGHREEVLSLENVPLDGIALDNTLALHGSPLVRIRPGDEGHTPEGDAARFGGEILHFSDETAFETARRTLSEAERKAVGPVVTYPQLSQSHP